MAISEDDLNKQNELIKEQIDLQAKLNRLRGEDISRVQQSMDTLREQFAMEQELSEIARIQFTNDADRIKFYDKKQEFLDKELAAGRISLNQKLQTQKLLDEIRDAEENGRTAELKDLEDMLSARQANTRELIAASQAASSLATNMARVVGFDRQAVQLGKSFGAAMKNLPQFGRVFAEEMSELLSPSGVFGQVIANTFLLAGGLARQEAAFVSATGITQDFKGEVIDLKKNFGELVSVLDIFPIIQSLNVGFIGFKNLNKSVRDEMSKTALILRGFGVSAEQTADALNELTKRARVLPEDASEALLALAGLTEDTTFPITELISSFSAAQTELSIFGPKGVKIFGNLAKSAANMGLRVGEGTQMLLKMVQGFDTFESAATKVATINAALGGSFIDTFSMVMATAEGPGAQLSLLESALDNAGVNADNFGDNIFQAKLLADGFGVSVDNLRAFLSGEIDESEVFLTTQDKMMKLLEKSVDPMTQLSNSVQDLSAFVAGSADAFSSLLKGVSKLVDFFANNLFGQITGVIYLLGPLLGPLLFSTSAAFSGIALAIAGIAGVFYIFDSLIDGMAETREGAVALGAAIAGISGALLGAVKGFAVSGGNPLGALVGAIAGGAGGAAIGSMGGDLAFDEKNTMRQPTITERIRSTSTSPTMQDGFVETDSEENAKITPFSTKDKFYSAKDGGTLQKVMAENTAMMMRVTMSNPTSMPDTVIKLIEDFVKASKRNENREIRVYSEVKMPNGRVLADAVNTENDRRNDLTKY